MKKNKGLALSLSKGFTLIELLVVISIIGVLSALGLVGVSGAQKQARDATRRNDLSQYRTALENKYTATGSYINQELTTAAARANVALVGLGGTAGYLSTGTLPADPKATAACTLTGTDYNYCYISNSDSDEYVLWTRLEASGQCYVQCGLNNTVKAGKSGLVGCQAITAVCPLP